MVTTITADQLADKLDSGEEFALIDTRPAESFESWHVSGARNLPHSPDDALDERAVDDVLRNGEEIVTICAKGVSSMHFAEQLEDAGYGDVTVVEGGMEAWSEVYETVAIDTDDDAVEIIQVQRRAKGCLGYVVGATGSGEAAAIDVTRHTDVFREAAESAGYDVVRVLDTHVHADHLSGGRKLADELGVPYHLGAAAETRNVQYDFDAIAPNGVVTVGDVQIKAIHTPGHTSDIVSYLVNAEAVMTGDTLFVESVGRTELQFGDAGAEEGAHMLYETLHHKLLSLPDFVTVLPGHITVTDEGEWEPGEPGAPVSATVGELRTGLDVLQLDEDEFVQHITEDVPEKPPNFETVIAINSGVQPLEGEQQATELELGPNRCAAP